MNIFKTLLRIKEPNELRAALEELAQGFEYDSQYKAHNRYIEGHSQSTPARSTFSPSYSPRIIDNDLPSFNNNNDSSFGGFGGGDFGGGGSGGDW